MATRGKGKQKLRKTGNSRQLSRCGRVGRDLDPDCRRPQKGWAHDHTG